MINHCEVTYIYGLYEVGKEEQIRYIGKSNNIKKRLHDHRYDNRKTSHKSCWIKSVLSNGGKIGAIAIAVVDMQNWKEIEKYYIAEYRKTNKLVNLTDGGDGTLTNIYNKTLQECKEFLKENKPEWVNSLNNYKKWSKMDDFPKFLPKAPNKVFNDWIDWGDYLGTNYIRTIHRKKYYLSFNEAKEYLAKFNFKKGSEFLKINFPYFISKSPELIYKNDWKGWPDFLGYEPYFRTEHNYLNFEDAKKWIYENYGQINVKKYRELSRKNLLPLFLPKKPEKLYENFKWCEYLFSNRNNKSKEFYMNFEDARDIARTLGLKTNKEWRSWRLNRSIDYIRIPGSPDYTYKDKWVSWSDWLGT